MNTTTKLYIMGLVVLSCWSSLLIYGLLREFFCRIFGPSNVRLSNGVLYRGLTQTSEMSSTTTIVWLEISYQLKVHLSPDILPKPPLALVSTEWSMVGRRFLSAIRRFRTRLHCKKTFVCGWRLYLLCAASRKRGFHRLQLLFANWKSITTTSICTCLSPVLIHKFVFLTGCSRARSVRLYDIENLALKTD